MPDLLPLKVKTRIKQDFIIQFLTLVLLILPYSDWFWGYFKYFQNDFLPGKNFYINKNS